MFPSPDVIATAIYAAARAIVPTLKLNATVLQVAHGAKDLGARTGYAGGFPLARVRVYAGVVLWDAYPEASRAKIGKCLGQFNADAWASKLERDLRLNMVKWWDDDIECAVRAAVDWAMEREVVPGFLPAKENPAPMESAGLSR